MCQGTKYVQQSGNELIRRIKNLGLREKLLILLL